MMKILVIGLGNIAKRHITNLKGIDSSLEIAVLRHNLKAGPQGENTSEVSAVFGSWDEVFKWEPQAALITNPSTLHIETARLLAEAGVHLFIEKPISHSTDGIDDLIHLCKKRALTLMVGYNFRFYIPFRKIKEALEVGKIGKLMTVRAEVGHYLPDWRPAQDYRTTVSARKSLGGGVIAELSHELDYIRFLTGEITSVCSVADKLSDLDIDVEDTAAILLRLASGGLGTVHLDMTDRSKNRQCRIVGTEGTIVWNGLKHDVNLYSVPRNTWEPLYSGKQYDTNQMYLEEIKHFFDCIENNKRPLVTGEDGKRVVELMQAIKQSASSKQEVHL